MSNVFPPKCSPWRRDTEGNIIFKSTPHELERQILLLWEEITKLKDSIKLSEKSNDQST